MNYRYKIHLKEVIKMTNTNTMNYKAYTENKAMDLLCEALLAYEGILTDDSIEAIGYNAMALTSKMTEEDVEGLGLKGNLSYIEEALFDGFNLYNMDFLEKVYDDMQNYSLLELARYTILVHIMEVVTGTAFIQTIISESDYKAYVTNKGYETMLNSQAGILSVTELECDEYNELKEHERNIMIEESTLEELESELMYQGFSLDDITRNTVSPYGNFQVYHDMKEGSFLAVFI